MSSPSLPPELDAPSLAAIFLGASKFDNFPQLDNPAFLASKDAFRAAFGNSNLSIFGNRIATLDLFDRPDNPIEAIRQIRGFLEANHHCSDIFLYYCGHGHFLADNTFVLMLRSTENGLEYTTGLQSSVLKNPFQRHRGNKRLFIILDCCYAGEVARSWMSTDAQPRITRQWANDFPKQGTVLAVAAPKDKVALSPTSETLTMFTGALVETMRAGMPEAQRYLSFRDLVNGASKRIAVRDDFVMPELHQPEQEAGDVTLMPFFANAAFGKVTDPALQAQIDGALELLMKDGMASRLLGLADLNEIPLNRVAIAFRQTVVDRLAEVAKSDDSNKVREFAEQVRGRWFSSLPVISETPTPSPDDISAVVSTAQSNVAAAGPISSVNTAPTPIQLPPLTSEEQKSFSAQGNRLIFSDDFTEFDDSWNVSDFVALGDRRLVIKPPKGTWHRIVYQGFIVSDADISVVVRSPNSLDKVNDCYGGLLVRVLSWDDLYHFILRPTGRATIGRYQSGEWRQIVSSRPASAARIGPAAKNVLRILMTGTRIVTYVNGSKFASVGLPSGGGHIGLAAASEESRISAWKFSSLHVTNIASPA